MSRKCQTTTALDPALVVETAERRILFLRGQRVLLDSDLAVLYGVSTGRLNEQVRRNRRRFPSDFMFELSAEEAAILRSQFAISKRRGGRRTPPLVFTEHGVAMLSSVLHSERAVQVNIGVMRAFGRLRRMLAPHEQLARKLEEMEKKYDSQFHVVFDAIRALLQAPTPPKRPIGFRRGER